MREPREGRRMRKISKPESAVPAAAEATVEPQWNREPRPLLPPPRVGREWDRVRRIAYL